MAKFHSMLRALAQGESVRRRTWDPINRLFISESALMCQCGVEKPWRCALSWDELSADDWQIAKGVFIDSDTSVRKRRGNNGISAI